MDQRIGKRTGQRMGLVVDPLPHKMRRCNEAEFAEK